MTRLINELRQKHPRMGIRAQRSPLAAIRLFCLECMGGAPGEVRRCSTSECSLHPFRFDARPGRGQPETTPETAEAASVDQ